MKLVVNGICPFDEFCEETEHAGNLRGDLLGLFRRVNDVANQRRLPQERLRDITPSGERVREIELKKGSLRLYMIKDSSHIIILGGKKNSQGKDIKKFRSLKHQFLESKAYPI